MGLARTRKEARQIVDHKHVLVNGKQVNIPSYLIKAGDVIEIKEKCKGSQRYKDILEVTAGRLVPEWVEVDQEALKGTVKELPTERSRSMFRLTKCLSSSCILSKLNVTLNHKQTQKEGLNSVRFQQTKN